MGMKLDKTPKVQLRYLIQTDGNRWMHLHGPRVGYLESKTGEALMLLDVKNRFARRLGRARNLLREGEYTQALWELYKVAGLYPEMRKYVIGEIEHAAKNHRSKRADYRFSNILKGLYAEEAMEIQDTLKKTSKDTVPGGLWNSYAVHILRKHGETSGAKAKQMSGKLLLELAPRLKKNNHVDAELCGEIAREFLGSSFLYIRPWLIARV